jgi:hypothetical protein
MPRDVYVQYSAAPVARTVEATAGGAHPGVMVDLDELGQIVGVLLQDVATVTIDGEQV